MLEIIKEYAKKWKDSVSSFEMDTTTVALLFVSSFVAPLSVGLILYVLRKHDK